jgi:hypothetical protein
VTEVGVELIYREGSCPHCGLHGAAIVAELNKMNERLGSIMSEDAAVQEVTADLGEDVTELTAAFQSIAASFATLSANAASGDDQLSPSSLAALQAIQAQVDSLTTSGTAQAASEAAEAGTPAAPASSDEPAAPAESDPSGASAPAESETPAS